MYDAVLRVMRASLAGAVVGKLHRDWTRESQAMMNQELLALGLITEEDVKKHAHEEPACRKYFMHGLGHPLGLDVHDVGLMHEPFAPGVGADGRARHLHSGRRLRHPAGKRRAGDGKRAGRSDGRHSGRGR